MNKELSIRTIDPLQIASKLDAIRNFLLPDLSEELAQRPRIVEAMWFLQWVSMPENFPGGLAKFTRDFLAVYRTAVGPLALFEAGDQPFTQEVINGILEQIPHENRPELVGSESGEIGYAALLDSLDGRLSEEAMLRVKAARTQSYERLNFTLIQEFAFDHAEENLAEFFLRACTDPDVNFAGRPLHLWSHGPGLTLWYFPKLWDCLFDCMDRRANLEGSSLAETSITKDVFRWLEIAETAGKGVMFIGHSRFGKSHTIRAFAKMYPGRVRIVECPSSSSESDLLRALTRALGVRFLNTTPPLHEQRAAIEAVLRQGKLLIIFDEAQFLFPQNGTRRSVPPRLNYVRRSIMDLGVPTAFVCTYQNWQNVERNFLKVTAYSIEQFEGRLLRSPIHLTNELTEAEMIEVARIHLPELDDDYLIALARPVRSFKGDHLSCIEHIALIARHYAKERGGKVPLLEDLERAMNDVLACDAKTTSGQVALPSREDRPQLPARTGKSQVALSRDGDLLPTRETRPSALSTPRTHLDLASA